MANSPDQALTAPQEAPSAPQGRPGALDYELTVMLVGYGVYFDPIKHTAYMRLLEEFPVRVQTAALRIAAKGWERRPAHAAEVAGLARIILKHGLEAAEHGALCWKGSSSNEQIQRANGAPPLDALEVVAARFALRQQERNERMLAQSNPVAAENQEARNTPENLAHRQAFLDSAAKLFGDAKTIDSCASSKTEKTERRPKTAEEIEAGLAALEAKQNAEKGAQFRETDHV
jgi:hypothetical protein